MKRFLSAILLFAAACTTAPNPSEYRQARLDAGVEKSVPIGGQTLHYWDKGTGPAILLLHGLGGSMYDWRFLYDDLVEAGYRVIALDALGAGYSDKPGDGDYTIPAYAERVVALLDALGIPKVHLVGNSYGGGVGLWLALHRPERLDKLVLLNAASMPQEFPFYVRAARCPVLSFFGALFVEIGPRQFIARLGLNKIYSDNSRIRDVDVEEYAHEYGFHRTARALMDCARQLDVRLAEQMAPQYARIATPTLILWGDNDEITPLSVGQALHEVMPGSKLVVFADCGHCPQMEHPQQTLRLILDFLRSHDGVKSVGRAAGRTARQ